MAINQKRLIVSAVILCAIAATTLTFFGYCKSGVTTVVLVTRHAEKAETPRDNPTLSTPEGFARAQTLVHVAGQAGVNAIFATQYLRTQQTVQPLATHLGLAVTQIADNDVDGLISQILENHRGETVLVAGHSTTVPLIIQKLVGGTIMTIPESQFDNLFVVIIPKRGKKKVVHLKYGVPSPTE